MKKLLVILPVVLAMCLGVTFLSSCAGGGGSSSPPPCVNLVEDGSFEYGGAWTEYSYNYGTPVGDVIDFGGTGGGTGPRTGFYWTWLGGTSVYEVASVSQILEIPPGADTLQFYLEIPACAFSGLDIFRVEIDGIDVYLTDNYDPYCDTTGYWLENVDIAGFDDGDLHSLVFKGEVFGEGPPGSDVTNFFVDDVRIIYCGP
jgi:hypothetical protein